MVKKKQSEELATRKVGLSSKRAGTLSIGALEAALLADFPAKDACEGDKTGLLVGDPLEPLKGVAVALDPTVSAIRLAHDVGANVLVTHHPSIYEAPVSFRPVESNPLDTGAIVWEAIDKGVALMNFHTTLDFSIAAQAVLPGMLGLTFQSVLCPLEHDARKGFGQICVPAASDEPMSLGQLAARCTSVFGRPPRVWGKPTTRLRKIATATGSATFALKDCFDKGVECLVCGELKYHASLDASQAGLCIIELGHDVSELPLVAPLAAAIRHAGVPEELITVLNQSDNWYIPETTRV